MAAQGLLIEANGLCRDYAAVRAVDGVDLCLERGEVLGLLGQNGAGKSTTMDLLCGLLAPSAGRIAIDGVDLLESPRMAKRALGYLPEYPPLYGEMEVAAFLRFAAALRGLARPARRAAVDRVLGLCSLEAVARRPIANLSKGYRQRVGIAQAIVHDPPAVVLDEPTVGLDPVQIREIRALIAELGREHGVLLSTHILPEVQALCSRVAILHQGRIVHSAPVGEFATSAPAERVRLALEHPPGESRLAAIDGVTAVEAAGAATFWLRIDSTRTTPAAIAEQAVTAGWGLNALVPEQASLEQVFVECTTADPSAEPAA